MTSHVTPAGQQAFDKAVVQALRPTTRPTGWYSCNCAAEDESDGQYPWHPVLQTDNELNLHIEIGFTAQDECDQFVADHIVGHGMYDA